VIIAVDFDGTIVSDDQPFEDVKTPLRFMPGARQGLLRLRAAGHTLILFSARANAWMFRNPEMDPLVQAKVRKLDQVRWEKNRPLHLARYEQMLTFIKRELPGVFALVWEHQGKPPADVFIDDRSAPFRLEGWRGMVHLYGDSEGHA
jgi:hypothetical protein